MAKYYDLTGNSYGRLIVIKRDENNTTKNSYWICKCKCGNYCSVRRENLVKGITISCGCFRKEKIIKRSSKTNIYKLKNDTIEIYDSKGNKTLIDKECYDKVKDYYWSLNGGYWISQKNGKQKLHRVLIGAKDMQIVDHINGDTSDNRLSNLRICSAQQNCMNRKIQSNNTTGVAGVTFSKLKDKYLARIKVGGKSICLGYYSSLDEAKRVRLLAEKEYFGDYRRNKDEK